MTTRTTLGGHTVTDEICPLCGAKPGWPCRDLRGHYVAPHKARLEGLALCADDLLKEHRGW